MRYRTIGIKNENKTLALFCDTTLFSSLLVSPIPFYLIFQIIFQQWAQLWECIQEWRHICSNFRLTFWGARRPQRFYPTPIPCSPLRRPRHHPTHTLTPMDCRRIRNCTRACHPTLRPRQPLDLTGEDCRPKLR